MGIHLYEFDWFHSSLSTRGTDNWVEVKAVVLTIKGLTLGFVAGAAGDLLSTIIIIMWCSK